jgi:hypothetical protein
MSGRCECQRGTSEATPLSVTRSVGPNTRTIPATRGGANVRIVAPASPTGRSRRATDHVEQPSTPPGRSRSADRGGGSVFRFVPARVHRGFEHGQTLVAEGDGWVVRCSRVRSAVTTAWPDDERFAPWRRCPCGPVLAWDSPPSWSSFRCSDRAAEGWCRAVPVEHLVLAESRPP